MPQTHRSWLFLFDFSVSAVLTYRLSFPTPFLLLSFISREYQVFSSCFVLHPFSFSLFTTLMVFYVCNPWKLCYSRIITWLQMQFCCNLWRCRSLDIRIMLSVAWEIVLLGSPISGIFLSYILTIITNMYSLKWWPYEANKLYSNTILFWSISLLRYVLIRYTAFIVLYPIGVFPGESEFIYLYLLL
jgi:hypothetical protein